MTYAERFGWTPDQVDALPDRFVDELDVYIVAQADHNTPKPGAK